MGSYNPRGQQIFVVFISLGVVFIFIFYKQARLSGVSAVSFAISECEWGVYFQGCHRNHCICGDSDWGCRPGKILLFLSWVNTWHTCMRAPCAHCTHVTCGFVFFLSLGECRCRQTQVRPLVVRDAWVTLNNIRVCVCSTLFSAVPDIQKHLHHDNSSNRCPLNLLFPLHCCSANQQCLEFKVLTEGDCLARSSWDKSASLSFYHGEMRFCFDKRLWWQQYCCVSCLGCKVFGYTDL